MIPIPYRLKDATTSFDNALTQAVANLRVALPGIVQSFDPVAQTVVVQPAIRESYRVDGVSTDLDLPALADVPILVPRGGGFSVTLPVQAGDECLIVFADLCIDAWHEAGGVQGQPVNFRHAIGDGFAILGPWSKPRNLSNYAANSLQIRSDDGQTVIDVAEGAVTVTSPAVNVVSPNVSLAASGGTPTALIGSAFYTWFTTIYMPSVRYLTAAPALPAPAPLTTVVKGQ